MDTGSVKKIITLTTDFGTKDPFVGTMKGVILSICPDAILIDITHQIEPYHILEAALTLKASHHFFPVGTVHLAVIDPGVGGPRRPILAETAKYCFVAPDNGVLSLVYQDKELKAVREITAREFFLTPEDSAGSPGDSAGSPDPAKKRVSSTFHGRDIFAPVAAWLARGEKPECFGPIIYDYNSLLLPEAQILSDTHLRGKIIYIDSFGNLMSNIDHPLFQSLQDKNKGRGCQISLGPKVIKGINRYYGEAREKEAGAIFNSWGYLEVYINQGNAHQQLGLGTGTAINIIFF